MNCHIPTKNAVSNEEARALNKYLDGQRIDTMRRFFKIMCVALNNEFGFGHDRLMELIVAISNISAEADKDEIYWHHVDKVVINELKLPFDKEGI